MRQVFFFFHQFRPHFDPPAIVNQLRWMTLFLYKRSSLLNLAKFQILLFKRGIPQMITSVGTRLLENVENSRSTIPKIFSGRLSQMVKMIDKLAEDSRPNAILYEFES